MKNKRNIELLHSLFCALPMIALYAIGRSSDGWMRWYLPDVALAHLAFSTIYLDVNLIQKGFGFNIKNPFLFSFVCSIFIGPLFEGLQYFDLFEGTYDPYDFVAFITGSLLTLILFVFTKPIAKRIVFWHMKYKKQKINLR